MRLNKAFFVCASALFLLAFAGFAGSTSTETILPNGAGSYAEFTTVYPAGLSHWESVDDGGSFSNYSDGISSNTASQRDSFSLSNPVYIGAGNPIISVNVGFEAKWIAGTTRSLNHTIITGGTQYNCSATTNLLATFANYTCTWLFNPNTLVAWTLPDLNSLEAGARIHTVTGGANVTRLWADVSYNNAAPNVSLSSPANGSTAVPNVNFTFTPIDDGPFKNCTTLIWYANGTVLNVSNWNATSITNASTNGINYVFAASGTYLWNVECWDADSAPLSNRSTSNYTVTILNTNLTDCINITLSGNYSLTGNVSSPSSCFTISANNVTLDCNGYAINFASPASGSGVRVANYRNLTVKNCVFANVAKTSYGVNVGASTNGTVIQNNSFTVASTDSANPSYGVYLGGASNVTVYDNSFAVGAYSYGIYFAAGSSNNRNTSNNSITLDNPFSFDGVYLINSGFNDFSNNTVNASQGLSGYAAVRLTYTFFQPGSTTNNTFSFNSLAVGAASYDGVFVSSGIGFPGSVANNTIQNNSITLTRAASVGINSSTGDTNCFLYNFINASGSGSYGVLFNSSNNNTLNGNNVTAVGRAFEPNNSNNTNVTNNFFTATGSTGYAVVLSASPGVLLSNNTLRSAFIDFSSDSASGSEGVGPGVFQPAAVYNTTFNSSNEPTKVSFKWSGAITVNSSDQTAIEGDPSGYRNISKYVNVTNSSAAWVSLNVSYADGDWQNAGVYSESTLRLRHFNGTMWALIAGSGVDTVNNYVYGNVTQFSDFAPFGEADAVNVSLSSPANASWNSTRNVNFTFTPFTFTGFKNCTTYVWYENGTLLNDTNWNASNIANNTVNGGNYTFAADGTYLWNVECWNNQTTPVRNSSSANYTVFVDATASSGIAYLNPTPLNGSYRNWNYSYVNVTFTESNPDSCFLNYVYSNSSNVNLSMARIASTCWFNVSSQPEGQANFTVYVNDSAGIWGANTTYYRFFVDKTIPSVAPVSPADGNSTNASSIVFSFNASDAISPTLNCTLYLNGSASASNSSVSNATLTVFSVSGLSAGNYSWNVSCFDSAGNWASGLNRSIQVNASAAGNFSFSNVRVTDIMSTQATVRFDTSAPTTDWVWYSLYGDFNPSLNSSVNEVLASLHAVVLTGLTMTTTYYYRACGADASNASACSSVYSFTTVGGGGPGPTPTPTPVPTATPTSSPSPSPTPSLSPTPTLTSTPSVEPTIRPTVEPSVGASVAPTPTGGPDASLTPYERNNVEGAAQVSESTGTVGSCNSTVCRAGESANVILRRTIDVIQTPNGVLTRVTLRVSNEGKATAFGVSISEFVDVLSNGEKVEYSSAPQNFFEGGVEWVIDVLPPGAVREFSYGVFRRATPAELASSRSPIVFVRSAGVVSASLDYSLFYVALLVLFLAVLVFAYSRKFKKRKRRIKLNQIE